MCNLPPKNKNKPCQCTSSKKKEENHITQTIVLLLICSRRLRMSPRAFPRSGENLTRFKSSPSCSPRIDMSSNDYNRPRARTWEAAFRPQCKARASGIWGGGGGGTKWRACGSVKERRSDIIGLAQSGDSARIVNQDPHTCWSSSVRGENKGILNHPFCVAKGKNN